MIITDKKELLIGVLSDTHVPSRTDNVSEIVYEEFKNRNVDYIFHLGDFTSFEVYNQLIETFGEDKVIAILGNMDFDNRLKNKLPDRLELELIGHKILMLHGMGGPNMIIKRLQKKCDLSGFNLVIFGHTHRPVNETHDGILFFNPGTTTPIDNKFTVVSSFGFLKINEREIKPEIVYLEQ